MVDITPAAIAGSAAIDAIAIEPTARAMQINAARIRRDDSSAAQTPHDLHRLAE
jgi:hypothetical protein